MFNIYQSSLRQTIHSKDLYNFLELDLTHYSKWCKTNIIKNPFAEEKKDYSQYSASEDKRKQKGNFATHYDI